MVYYLKDLNVCKVLERIVQILDNIMTDQKGCLIFERGMLLAADVNQRLAIGND